MVRMQKINVFSSRMHIGIGRVLRTGAVRGHQALISISLAPALSSAQGAATTVLGCRPSLLNASHSTAQFKPEAHQQPSPARSNAQTAANQGPPKGAPPKQRGSAEFIAAKTPSSSNAQGKPSQKSFKLKPRALVLEESELVEKYSRGSGKGGQSVAKTSNRVQLTHIPTGLAVAVHTYVTHPPISRICKILNWIVDMCSTRNRDLNRRIARKRLTERVSLLVEGKKSYVQVREDKKREKQLKANSHAKGKHEWRAYLKQVLEFHEGKEKTNSSPLPVSSAPTPPKSRTKASRSKFHTPSPQAPMRVRVGRTHKRACKRAVASFKAHRRNSMFRAYRHAVSMWVFKRVTGIQTPRG
jgi:hypothetical protein